MRGFATAAPGVDDAQLIAMVADELRQPLFPIRHAAAMLSGAAPDAATVQRAAEIIQREANSMNRLIGDMIDVSRMEMGTLELFRKRAPLSELMDRAIESAEPFARVCGHRLSVSVPAEPVYLQMDVPRLGHALNNLIANACKYTDKRGHIYIRAQRHGARVSIVVSDSGVGIPAAQLESVFGLFAQAGQDGPLQAGLGLGLYLARRFVEAHGGTVTAASAGENRGSEFTILVPCESSTAMVPESARGEQSAVDRSPVSPPNNIHRTIARDAGDRAR